MIKILIQPFLPLLPQPLTHEHWLHGPHLPLAAFVLSPTMSDSQPHAHAFKLPSTNSHPPPIIQWKWCPVTQRQSLLCKMRIHLYTIVHLINISFHLVTFPAYPAHFFKHFLHGGSLWGDTIEIVHSAVYLIKWFLAMNDSLQDQFPISNAYNWGLEVQKSVS